MRSQRDNDACVILFARTPVYGRVKTRLAVHIGRDAALRLYASFLADMRDKIARAGLALRICYFPPGSRLEMIRLMGAQFDYFPQSGDDLGERMAHAFADTFAAGFQKAVLIGSDFPDLPQQVPPEALSRLNDNDCVIGPAADGGYYLIGFRQDTFDPAVFNGISWSTDAVYSQTRDKLEKKGRKPHIMMQWRDIDDWPDLAVFIKNGRGRINDAPVTRRYLETLKLTENRNASN